MLRFLSRAIAAILLSTGSAGGSCTAAARLPPSPERNVATASWLPFRWAGASFGSRHEPRAALLVPVTLEGVPGTYYLQLDTGAGWPRWYEVPLRQLIPAAFGPVRDTAPDELVLRGGIGGVAIATDTFAVEKGFGDALPPSGTLSETPRVIGTLGLRFFRHRMLVLDFPRQRLAIVENGRSLPADAPRDVTYVPAHYVNGHLFVPITVAGRAVNDFFYDSGASALPMTTTAATWRTFTGRTGAEADNLHLTLSSWGRQLPFVGAPVDGDVVFGPFRFAHPLIVSQREQVGQRDFFTSAPYPVGGHFGNALFYDRHIIVIDVPGRRFGLALGR